MTDELFKIMATMNILSNVQQSLTEWSIIVPLIFVYLINNNWYKIDILPMILPPPQS